MFENESHSLKSVSRGELRNTLEYIRFHIEQLTLIAARHSAAVHHLIETHLHQGSDNKPRLVAAAAEHSDALEKVKNLLELQQGPLVPDKAEGGATPLTAEQRQAMIDSTSDDVA